MPSSLHRVNVFISNTNCFTKPSHLNWKSVSNYRNLTGECVCVCGCWGGSVKERVCGWGLWFGSPDTLGPQEILSKRSWRSVQPPSLLTSCLEAGCSCWHCSPTTEELRTTLPFRLLWLRIKWNSAQRKPQQPSGPPYCRKTSGLNFSTTEGFC